MGARDSNTGVFVRSSRRAGRNRSGVSFASQAAPPKIIPSIPTTLPWHGNPMTINWQAAFSKVRAALMRQGRSRQDADDLVQEAYLKLATEARRQSVLKPEAFLMRAALNLSLDAHRVSRNHGEQVLLDDAVLISTTPSTEDTVLARERTARLSECLSKLDPKTLRIFLAHRIEGMSYVEIARANGVSVSAVEKHIAKAALVLTRSMEGWWP